LKNLVRFPRRTRQFILATWHLRALVQPVGGAKSRVMYVHNCNDVNSAISIQSAKSDLANGPAEERSATPAVVPCLSTMIGKLRWRIPNSPTLPAISISPAIRHHFTETTSSISAASRLAAAGRNCTNAAKWPTFPAINMPPKLGEEKSAACDRPAACGGERGR
jgi:hypothetical protein